MRLALGTAQFGMSYGISNVTGKVSLADGGSILSCAASAGIDTIDTAMAYGDSEKVLGDIGVPAFKLVTKLPEIPRNIPDVRSWVISAVKDSISRLRVASLHGLLLHRPSQLLGSDGREILSALKVLKDQGLVARLGVSVSAPSELDALFRLYDFDIVQCPFSLVDRRLSTSGWLSKLNDAGVEIHTRSCFLQGLLLMPRCSVPTQFQAWDSLWHDWEIWIQKNNTSPVGACISYVLSFPEIHRAIVGVEKRCQLEEIVLAASAIKIREYPDISSDDLNLINPTNWNKL